LSQTGGGKGVSSEVAAPGSLVVESVFVSYTRADHQRVGKLLDGLKRLGYRVWHDQELSGGQEWWDVILRQIRECDGLLLVVSPAQLDSEACREEVTYARSLGKSVLPVMIQDVPVKRLPRDLALLQLVDYTGRSENEAFELMGALKRLPVPAALPDPLPAAPPVPMSYINDLYTSVDAKVLTLEQQYGLIGQLRQALGEPEAREQALDILRRLNRRHDLYRDPAAEIEAMLTRVPLTSKATSARSAERKRARRRLPGVVPWFLARPAIIASGAAGLIVVALLAGYVLLHRQHVDLQAKSLAVSPAPTVGATSPSFSTPSPSPAPQPTATPAPPRVVINPGTPKPPPPTPSPTPVLTVQSVIFTGTTASPKVTVTGSNFGSEPVGVSDNNNSCGRYTNNGYDFGPNFTFDDPGNFTAGSGTPPSGTCVGIIVTSWSATQIVFVFGNAYNSFDHWYLTDGDKYVLSIKGVQASGQVGGL